MANAIKKSAAIALAAGLAFSTVAGTSALTVAQAQSGENAIGTEGGTLTVHKSLNPTDLLESSNGQVAPDVSKAGKPLENVVFQATKLKFDLTKPDQFEEAAKLAANPEKASSHFTNPKVVKEATTGPNGEAIFELELGAYLIEELPSEELLANGLVPSAPFIVYMPMTNPDGKGWNRKVHVYPKNTELTSTTKEVDDKDKHPVVGDKLAYTIKSTVPLLPEKRKLTSFSLVDSFKKEELTDLAVGEVTLNGTPLTVNTDYKVITNEEPGKSPADANTTITVALTSARVKALKADDTLSVALSGTVSKVSEGLEDGTVVNSARTEGSAAVTDGNRENPKTVPVFVKDPQGNLVPIFDEDGNLKTDKDGNPFLDKNGNPAVPVLDENGNPVLDENGKPVVVPLFDDNGKPVKVYDEEGNELPPSFVPTPIKTPDVSVTSYVGKVLIRKTGGDDQPVEGTAKFDVYNGVGNDCSDTSGAKILEGFAVTDGFGEIDALHVTDFENNAEKQPAGFYCLVETEAPAGYILNDEPEKFELTRADVEQASTVDGYNLISKPVDFVNYKQPKLTLPMTGGAGVALLILAGLTIVGGGAYAARRNSVKA